MSKALDFIVDPFNLFNNFGLNLGKDKKKEEAPKPGPQGKSEGVISDAEAADLARKRLFRSGTVYTSTLGEEIDPNSLAGTRLQ